MHRTACDLVKGHIDSDRTGWCFHIKDYINPLRLNLNNGNCVEIKKEYRFDVLAFYKLTSVVNCGWSIPESYSSGTIEMLIDGIWTKIYDVKSSDNTITEIDTFQHKVINPESTQFCPGLSDYKPTLIVIDNFYAEPDKVREFALKTKFEANISYFKGCRSASFRFPGIKERFEQLMCKKITSWDHDPNGCFQYCIAEDKSVYHCDLQQYAAIVYLAPDAPPQSGTQLYRSKITKNMDPGLDSSLVFSKGHYDSTNFESVDTVGNVYNRLVIFNSRLIHAAPIYFGNSLETGRLFQIFFFDAV